MSAEIPHLEDLHTTVVRDRREWIRGEKAMLPRIAIACFVGYALVIVLRPTWATALGAMIGAVLLLTGFVIVRQLTAVQENIQLLAERMAVDAQFRTLDLNTSSVSERIALQAELTHHAYHDPLTGLANRAWFRSRVEDALARAHVAPEHVVVFFLDLDTFKHVNDSLGHAEGDRMLIEVSTRLLNATRGSDTVTRLSGDEFAILVDRVTTEKDLIVIAERIANAMKLPFSLYNGEVFSSTSIGIARGVVAQTVDDLLHNADVAMKVSKRQGQGLYTIFESTMHADARQRLEFETGFRHTALSS